MQKCDDCFLLIYIPGVSKGNYCLFDDKIQSYKFNTKFKDVFTYNADKKVSHKLNMDKP